MQKGIEAARDLLLVSLLFLTDDVVPAVPHSGPYSDVSFTPLDNDESFHPVTNLLVLLSLSTCCLVWKEARVFGDGKLTFPSTSSITD